jgi:hypothetical protein
MREGDELEGVWVTPFGLHVTHLDNDPNDNEFSISHFLIPEGERGFA